MEIRAYLGSGLETAMEIRAYLGSGLETAARQRIVFVQRTTGRIAGNEQWAARQRRLFCLKDAG
jgi:hypothetical protein